jgi:hypothetical protein
MTRVSNESESKERDSLEWPASLPAVPDESKCEDGDQLDCPASLVNKCVTKKGASLMDWFNTRYIDDMCSFTLPRWWRPSCVWLFRVLFAQSRNTGQESTCHALAKTVVPASTPTGPCRGPDNRCKWC